MAIDNVQLIQTSCHLGISAISLSTHMYMYIDEGGEEKKEISLMKLKTSRKQVAPC